MRLLFNDICSILKYSETLHINCQSKIGICFFKCFRESNCKAIDLYKFKLYVTVATHADQLFKLRGVYD